MALAAAVYLSIMGKAGLRKVAELCYHKAHYAAEKIGSLKGFRLWSTGPFFHEFAVACPKSVSEINEALLDYDILGGYDLGQDYRELEDHMLIAVTEVNTKEEMDDLAEALQEVTRG